MSKIVYLAIALAATIVGGFAFHMRTADRVALEEATALCNRIQVGQSIDSLLTGSQQTEFPLSKLSEKSISARYQAWFPGFLANAVACDVYVQQGRVVSAFVEVHKW